MLARAQASLAVLLAVSLTPAAELVRLDATTWQRLPAGGECDAIHGDWLLAGDRVTAVVADTVAEPLRQGNTMTPDARGALLELAGRPDHRDHLTAFLPGGGIAGGCTYATAEALQTSGPTVRLRVAHPPTDAEPYRVETDYEVADGQAFVTVTTRVTNPGPAALRRPLADKLRFEGLVQAGPDQPDALAWVHERWYHAAVGVTTTGSRITREVQTSGREMGHWLRYPDLGTAGEAVLEPGQTLAWTRLVWPATDLAGLRAAWWAAAGQATVAADLTLTEPDGQPVAGAEVVARQGGKLVAAGASDAAGRFRLALPAGQYALTITDLARPEKALDLDLRAPSTQTIKLDPVARVEAVITDGDGQPVPCKVQFRGVAPTKDPDFGPWYATRALRNLCYTPDGTLRQNVPAGTYDVVLSRGPEADAVFQQVVVEAGRTTKLSARLPRVVDSRGYVAADFHGHTTESGDNQVQVTARVLCLAAEGIEFANSSDHVRLVDWQPAIDALGLGPWLRTCFGMEVSGPGAEMHHNAFPVRYRPGTQANGGIPAGGDLTAQTTRIADFDGGAPKLIIFNHPDVRRYFFREQHPQAWRRLHAIEAMGNPLAGKGRCFDWLLVLNQGHRLTGVANTDSHAAFHGAGYQRNWVPSPTDDPARIDPLAVMREVQAGHVVMSTGPFLEVTARGSAGGPVGPGDDLRAPDGRVTLQVRVECPNWLDINRVQVLANGQALPTANLTRQAQPERFGQGVVKFRGELPVTLERDAHLIVVAVGEGLTLAPVIGRVQGQPCAVSNPVYVDVDGGGFKANGDTLGAVVGGGRNAPVED